MPSLLQPRMGRAAYRTAIRTGAHRSGVRHRRAGTARGARRPGHGGRKRPRDACGDRRLGSRPELPRRGGPSGRTPATRIDDRTEPPGIRKQNGQWCKSATKIDDQREPSGNRKQRGGGASQPPRSTTGGSHQRPGNRRGGGYRLPVAIALGAAVAVVGVVYTANEDVRSRVDDFIGRLSGASASPTETPIDIEGHVQAAVATAQAPSSPAPDVRATTEAAIASTVEALLPTPTAEAVPLALASTPTSTRTAAPPHSPTPTRTATTPATATPTPTPTATATPTATPSPTPTATATPTATPSPTNTPTPTPTPEPRAVLVLEADAVIDGYWSDGTADVTVSATLRNDGDLRVDAPQTITSTCTPAAEGCHQEMTLDLPDGYRPGTATVHRPGPDGHHNRDFPLRRERADDPGHRCA